MALQIRLRTAGRRATVKVRPSLRRCLPGRLAGQNLPGFHSNRGGDSLPPQSVALNSKALPRSIKTASGYAVSASFVRQFDSNP